LNILTARENGCDIDNGVNALQNVREIRINEIIDNNNVHAISVLGVRSFHSGSFA